MLLAAKVGNTNPTSTGIQMSRAGRWNKNPVGNTQLAIPVAEILFWPCSRCKLVTGRSYI